MSGPASDEYSLRRLCREAREIPGSTGPVAKQHPLGLGIRQKQEYKLARGVARLPKVESGLTNLRKTTAEEIQFLSSALREPAWGELLGRPSLIAEIATPSPERLLAEGIVVPQSIEPGRLRELVLGVVVRPGDLTHTSGTLSSVPLAGIARLIVETSEHNPGISTNAWCSASWTASTVELISLLETCFLDSATSAQKSGKRSSAAALVDEAVVTETGDRLTAAAAICGYDLTTFAPLDLHDSAISAMRSRTPSLLLVQSSVLNQAHQVIELFSRASPRKPILLQATSPDGVLTALRARLHECSGVSSGLFLFGQNSTEEDDGYTYVTQTALPVLRAGRRARHPKFKVIVECLEAKKWYSRDLADHSRSGMVAFKCFESSATGLDWVADLDEKGQIITGKHKGPVGLHIPWKELAFE
ncbi:hypothetical protein ACFSUJ_23615 [Streptomyces lusitanus]|uniref:Uncharacterized protein n=1 Tax=Streptomyces lusitanus TaxID=68232 RepID=A0ABU3JS01_9ACTN|nr:hypothetical protein [Streptomyces lusitanus]